MTHEQLSKIKARLDRGDKVPESELIIAYAELYNLYERVSSDRINYINLWGLVPVEQRMKIHKNNEELQKYVDNLDGGL